MRTVYYFQILCLLCLTTTSTHAGVGDPQLRTDHPWYSGELSWSTFPRLQATQAEIFRRTVGHLPGSDEERALAAWMWRNLHYAHGQEGAQDLWGQGFDRGDTTNREFWTGLSAHGFGLCGTTHAQWTAELNELLGHGRSRTVGVVGHNALEVFLKGGVYGPGRWALLDHDLATVVFDPEGQRLLAIDEIRLDLARLIDPDFNRKRQHGWPLGGLHPDDPKAYAGFNVVEHLPGYAGPPPKIHLRRGEKLIRYYRPGLDDGETFVFWGRNYRTDGIPGPERSRTWVNQPERFYNSLEGSGFHRGQARFGNAVSIYRPDFHSNDYREGVVSENDYEVIFEFRTPFMIAATPPDDSDWGVYKSGCRNGLRIRSDADVPISVSIDDGRTWHGDRSGKTIDLTDFVKGTQQYWLKVKAPASRLVHSQLEITTVCQANPALFPRLKEHGSHVDYEASGVAITSVGPRRPHALQHVVDGDFDTPQVTLELSPSGGRPVSRIHAAAHIASSNPPDPEIRYQIEYSTNQGSSWRPVVKDWKIVRQGNEPDDFWSQSFCYGNVGIATHSKRPIQVRFYNNGGKRYLRCEAHLEYQLRSSDACQVTFSWSEQDNSDCSATQTFQSTENGRWFIETGEDIQMKSVEMTCLAGK